MATTATKVKQVPLAGCVLQVWSVAAGSSDTTATWPTGLTNVMGAWSCSQDDSSHGVIPNCYSGTEGDKAGSVYLAGVINSAKLMVLVIGN
jgi:hypothetical protein